MRLLGFVLLLAGWLLDLAAVVLLRAGAPLGVFLIAGLAVELLGLGLIVRTYMIPRGDRA